MYVGVNKKIGIYNPQITKIDGTIVLRNIAIKENEGPAMSHKEDNLKLVSYFLEVLPDYDQDRVYASDIKKIINWYNILQSKGLVSKETPVKEKELTGNEA